MRISDWSSDVCSSDLDAAFLHARLRDDPERPERLNNLPVEKFAAAIGFDADRGNGSPTFEAAMGVDGIRQYSVHLRLLHWIEGTWRAAFKRRDFKRRGCRTAAPLGAPSSMPGSQGPADGRRAPPS